jgi:diguanylate cyclase
MNAPYIPPKTGQSPKTGLIARWFGGRGDAPADAPHFGSQAERQFAARHNANIEALCAWLAAAGLEPSADTLALGWHAVTGVGEVGLSLIASARDADGHIAPTSVPQLMIALGLRQDRRAINAMIDQAKVNVGSAQAVTGDSSAAIADYRAAIAVPANAIKDPSRARAAITEMQGLTQSLLERTFAAEIEQRHGGTARTAG